MCVCFFASILLSIYWCTDLMCISIGSQLRTIDLERKPYRNLYNFSTSRLSFSAQHTHCPYRISLPHSFLHTRQVFAETTHTHTSRLFFCFAWKGEGAGALSQVNGNRLQGAKTKRNKVPLKWLHIFTFAFYYTLNRSTLPRIERIYIYI